jgi:hypothetical protein
MNFEFGADVTMLTNTQQDRSFTRGSGAVKMR